MNDIRNGDSVDVEAPSPTAYMHFRSYAQRVNAADIAKPGGPLIVVNAVRLLQLARTFPGLKLIKR